MILIILILSLSGCKQTFDLPLQPYLPDFELGPKQQFMINRSTSSVSPDISDDE